jgi:hypothetical protein
MVSAERPPGAQAALSTFVVTERKWTDSYGADLDGKLAPVTSRGK